MKHRLLFLCTGYSCRSQMAEGWARHLLDDEFEAYSAGVEPGTLDAKAVAVMAEAGVDISTHRAKSPDELPAKPFDLVVTVCDRAQESCPVFPGPARKIHRAFDDPPRLASAAVSEAETLAIYREVRDAIRSFVEMLPGLLEEPDARDHPPGSDQDE